MPADLEVDREHLIAAADIIGSVPTLCDRPNRTGRIFVRPPQDLETRLTLLFVIKLGAFLDHLAVPIGPVFLEQKIVLVDGSRHRRTAINPFRALLAGFPFFPNRFGEVRWLALD